MKRMFLIFSLLSSTLLYSNSQNTVFFKSDMENSYIKSINTIFINMERFNIFKIVVVNNINIEKNDSNKELKLDILENINELYSSLNEETNVLLKYKEIVNEKIEEKLLKKLTFLYDNKAYELLVNQLTDIINSKNKINLEITLEKFQDKVFEQNTNKYNFYLKVLDSDKLKENNIYKIFTQEQIDIVYEIRDDILANK